MLPQSIINIAEICSQKDLKYVVLSPGSRCAPLTVGFSRHPKIDVRTISDERSAAFIALGMAQQGQTLVGLVCTSGTAAYNYAPAIAEAYYRQIPLLIFTADRPPEWIDQKDGQAIRQRGLYGRHVKASYELPVDDKHPDAKWYAGRIISEGINLAMQPAKGPVHINIPIREPFYPSRKNQNIHFDKNLKVIDIPEVTQQLPYTSKKLLADELRKTKKVLIIAGQQAYDAALVKEVQKLSTSLSIPVIGDTLSNFHAYEQLIRHHDIILSSPKDNTLSLLKPDLLITFGGSVLSKSLKQFLRLNKADAHWHIDTSRTASDTFQSLTKVISVSPAYFFKQLHAMISKDKLPSGRKKYAKTWQDKEKSTEKSLANFFSNVPFGEFEAIKLVLESLPSTCMLHLANSMPVRYVNMLGILPKYKQIEVFSNRGTSGIDGCSSTAVGGAMMTDKITVLITGDMAFLYDRNAFWHSHIPSNLRIIVLNNHAGGIFRIIKGPDRLPEDEMSKYFETHQELRAENCAKDFGMEYTLCKNAEVLKKKLTTFFKRGKNAKIIEVETDSKKNAAIFKKVFNH